MNRYDREMLALAVPALGTLAVDPLVSTVDTIFVGRLGVVPLAALGINASVFSFTFVVFNFLAYGTTPLVAREVGRGDRAAAGRVVVQALVLAAGLGLLALAALEALAVPVVRLMGASGEVVGPAVEYLRIRALAGPAVLISTAGHGAFRGYHDTRTPLAVSIGVNAINLVLDPILIFGLGWGLAGAAWASAVAQWAGAAAFLWLVFSRRREELGVEPMLPRPGELLPLLRVGGTLAIRTMSLIGTMTLATAVAARVGTVAVAAHQVGAQVWLFLALVVDSIAIAAQAMVARYRGAGEPAAAREAGNRLLLWGAGLGLAIGAVFYLIAPVLPRLFTSDPAAIAAVGAILPFVVFMQPLNALVFVWDGIFLGAERFRFLAAQMAASAVAAGIVLLLVVPMGWGLTGVWWGIVALMGARAATLGWAWIRPTVTPRPAGGPPARG
ncbi:MAG: MATE family efflux transporter [Gemmatimonadota bacterium]|nr:MATE family efflux transporter [Gemmatimonadota bacterium]